MTLEDIRKAIESSSNYWERRALENKLNIIENEDDYIKRITRIYNKANKDIEDKLAVVYTRFAKENKLTLDEAYQILPKKMEKEYVNDVYDYIDKAKSGDSKWKSYLLNQSLMHKHSVLDQLRTEYRNVIYNIDMEETGGKFLEKIFTNSSYYDQYLANEEVFAKVDKDKIHALLKEDWSGGGNFSESIWKDKERLINALDDIVITGLATGESFDKMADKLSKRMETSKSNAMRLIRTESARMNNEGLLQRYKEMDVKELVFVATLDTRTSPICRAMDGEIIPIEQAQIGLNVPPLHPYCRSIISPHYDFNKVNDRIYRDNSTGKSISGGKYKTYKDYLEHHLGDKKQAEALASTKNGIRDLILAVGNTVTTMVDTKDLPSNKVVEEELTEEEKETIRHYSTMDYLEINRYLRGELKDIPQRYKDKIEVLDKALNKLPNIESNNIYRTMKFLDVNDVMEFLENYHVGDIKMFKEYLSTGNDSLYFANTSEVVFKIKSKTGKSIELYSQYPAEHEVLFRRNSTFRVDDIRYDYLDHKDKTGGKVYIIEMTEVILGD